MELADWPPKVPGSIDRSPQDADVFSSEPAFCVRDSKSRPGNRMRVRFPPSAFWVWGQVFSG